VIHDIRLALRSLWRVKAFSAAAAVTLAIGICGTTVMFALIEGVLLRPLPVREQDRLIIAWKEVRTSGSAQYPFGDREIESVAQASQLIERAAGLTRNGAGRIVISDPGVSDYANVAEVTGDFFEVLGVRPVIGRTILAADDKDGAERVVVLSSGLWRRRYGASEDIVGRRVTLDDQPFTIVGVLPGDLDIPSGVDLWRTTHSVAATGPFGDAVRREVNLVARLRPGVTIEQARQEITALSERIDAAGPFTGLRGLVPVVRPFADIVVDRVRTPLVALFVAVGLVLLIASANVANLLLMRGESRRRELALHAALGAGPGRIARQLLSESVILTVAAGVVGFVIASLSLPALVALIPGDFPRADAVRLDTAVVWFSAAVMLITVLLVGLIPARSAIHADVITHLRIGGISVAGSPSHRGRRTLIVAQVALAVSVVAAAGLLVRSVLKLQSVDLGLPTHHLALLELHIPQAKYVQRPWQTQFLDRAIAALQHGSVVAAATPINVSPFTGQGWDLPRWVADGQDESQAMANPSLDIESIHPNYFATMQVTIVRGRAFTEADREGATPVAIVSEDVADRTWPGEDAIGKRLQMGSIGSRDPWYTVVGVAARTRYRTVLTPFPTLYLPAAQFQMTATAIAVRTDASLNAVTSFARARIQSIDPDVRLIRVASFDDMLARPLAEPRFTSFLLTVFAGAALLLSTIGLYAVMSAFVRQREREIAVRLALGAPVRAVRRFVLIEVFRLAGVGIALGLAATMAATRVLRGILFEVHPLDPSALIAAIVLLLCASAIATYFPLRRAIRLDPIVVLRAVH
jgi:putative ABC transport system permease protein